MYIGDAAGRAKNWKFGEFIGWLLSNPLLGAPKDFSCSDRTFAHNVGVKFQTPEEFFLGESPAKFEWDSVDPAALLKNFQGKPHFTGSQPLTSSSQEMIILVGYPASGKSTFTERYLKPHGYFHVNQVFKIIQTFNVVRTLSRLVRNVWLLVAKLSVKERVL